MVVYEKLSVDIASRAEVQRQLRPRLFPERGIKRVEAVDFPVLGFESDEAWPLAADTAYVALDQAYPRLVERSPLLSV